MSRFTKAIIVTTIFTVAVSTVSAGQIVWPQPPEKARIQYEKSITKAEDIDIKKGFFAKIWDFFAGSEETVLIKPFGIHTDNGRIFVTDIGLASVVIFDTESQKMWTIDGYKGEKFISPIDVATDDDGYIYVTDSQRKALYIFNPKGIALKKIGSSEGLERPTGVAIDRQNGILYISDTVDSQIKRFKTGSLKPLKPVGSRGSAEGELNRPTFIALDGEGNLYVTDSMNFRVCVFDRDGKFLHSFGKLGNTIGSFASPRGIAVDKDGNIYVTDTLFDAVQIFDPKGNLLLVFGSKGKGKGEFYAPEDISISKEGKAYISDAYNMRVEVFRILSYNESK